MALNRVNLLELFVEQELDTSEWLGELPESVRECGLSADVIKQLTWEAETIGLRLKNMVRGGDDSDHAKAAREFMWQYKVWQGAVKPETEEELARCLLKWAAVRFASEDYNTPAFILTEMVIVMLRRIA